MAELLLAILDRFHGGVPVSHDDDDDVAANVDPPDRK